MSYKQCSFWEHLWYFNFRKCNGRTQTLFRDYCQILKKFSCKHSKRSLQKLFEVRRQLRRRVFHWNHLETIYWAKYPSKSIFSKIFYFIIKVEKYIASRKIVSKYVSLVYLRRQSNKIAKIFVLSAKFYKLLNNKHIVCIAFLEIEISQMF